VTAFDPKRLWRAAGLLAGVRRLGPRQYAVQGRAEEYPVDLDGDPPCYCRDAEHRGHDRNPCKHQLAARLVHGDLPLLRSLGQLTANPPKV
jgi:hypothetical protein